MFILHTHSLQKQFLMPEILSIISFTFSTLFSCFCTLLLTSQHFLIQLSLQIWMMDRLVTFLVPANQNIFSLIIIHFSPLYLFFKLFFVLCMRKKTYFTLDALIKAFTTRFLFSGSILGLCAPSGILDDGVGKVAPVEIG